MSKPIRPLAEVVAEIADPRQARGKRHPLPAVLLLSMAAMLCGYRSYAAIAEWGRHYGPELLRALGLTRATPPCAATLYLLFKWLDARLLDEKLGAWVEEVLAALPPEAGTHEVLACDGKTLRGSRKQGAPGAHLLAALAPRLGLPVAQTALAAKEGEQTALYTLLDGLLLQGRVVTVDALHTSTQVAETISQRGGFYLMMVKNNQPQLREDIATLFALPEAVAHTFRRARTTHSGHGRVERRVLTASPALRGFSAWPDLRQVFQIERTVIRKRTGEVRHETVYGVTNLPRTQASAADLLQYVQAHWAIENKSHYVRDVTFAEDHSLVRTGAIPHVLATLRSLAIGLARLDGATNIAAACRRYAAQPTAAVALLLLPPHN